MHLLNNDKNWCTTTKKYQQFSSAFQRFSVSPLISQQKIQRSVCSVLMSRIVIKPDFANAKTKPEISCAVTAQLICLFVFAIQIVKFLFYVNANFQASSLLPCPYRPVCVAPCRRHRRPDFFVSRLNYLKMHDLNTNHRKITKVNFHVQKVVSLGSICWH